MHISGPSMQRTPYGGDLMDPQGWRCFNSHACTSCSRATDGTQGCCLGGHLAHTGSATGNGAPTPPALLGQDGAGVERAAL